MGWWKRFKDWLEGERYEIPLKDWDPGIQIFLDGARLTPAECSDEDSQTGDIAPAVIPPISDDTRSDDASDGKSEPGEERKWFPCETIEGEPPSVTEPLEHAESLPSATFRVFPVAGNHRNSYDSEASVRRAVVARRASPSLRPGKFIPEPIKIYRAVTLWEDVSDEYVTPWTALP